MKEPPPKKAFLFLESHCLSLCPLVAGNFLRNLRHIRCSSVEDMSHTRQEAKKRTSSIYHITAPVKNIYASFRSHAALTLSPTLKSIIVLHSQKKFEKKKTLHPPSNSNRYRLLCGGYCNDPSTAPKCDLQNRWCKKNSGVVLVVEAYLIFVAYITYEICGEKFVMWRNLRFLCMTYAEKSEISPHVNFFKTSPHDQ